MKLIKAIGNYRNRDTVYFDNGIYININSCMCFEIKTIVDRITNDYHVCFETTEIYDQEQTQKWIIATYDDKDDADKKVVYLCNELFRTNTIIG